MEFSKQALQHLRARIDDEEFATGGYVMFFHYTHAKEHFLQVVMINEVSSSSIDPDAITVKEAIHLELAKLHVGGRINISSWKANDERYLSFIKGRGNEVARYFRYFLGCTDYTTAKAGTDQLVNAVRAYSVHKELTEEEKAQFEHKVYQYCQEQHAAKKEVYLDALSNYLDPENPSDFFGFANGEPHQVDTVITPDRASYKENRRGQVSLCNIHPRAGTGSVPGSVLDLAPR